MLHSFSASKNGCNKILYRVMLLMVIILLGACSLYGLNPPPALDETAPEDVFAAARAFRHIEAIASDGPRPIGTREAARAARYITDEITALGLTPALQETTIFCDRWGPRGGRVQNIIARIEGTDNTGSILIMGHYDSVPTAPGASDNGAAVGTMLEIMRIISSEEPLQNDVIFLFSDGEEVGLLGAKAFQEQHPLAREVAVVLNLEARGTGGPSIMFESSPENRALIHKLSSSVSRPVGNSFTNDVYRLMPNDTDLTIFLEAGYHGLNFAYIDDPVHYHTALDNLDNLNKNSLQHHGEYILPLVQALGNDNIREKHQAQNVVYFDVLGRFLIHYPEHWAIMIALLLTVFTMLILWSGFRKNTLTFKEIFAGFMSFIISVITVGGLITLAWHFSRPLLNLEGYIPPYNLHTFFAAFAIITVAVVLSIFFVFRSRFKLGGLITGSLICWNAGALATAFLLPGISYLFAWPLLPALAAAFLIITADAPKITHHYSSGNPSGDSSGDSSITSSRYSSYSSGYYSHDYSGHDANNHKFLVHTLMLSITALVSVLLWLPCIYLVFIAISSMVPSAAFIMLTMLLIILYPQLHYILPLQNWIVPVGATAAGLIIYGLALSGSGPAAERPWMNAIIYSYNAETREALWINPLPGDDEWTEQFVAKEAKWMLPDYFDKFYFGEFRADVAPPLPAEFSPPHIEVLDETQTDSGSRELRLLITSPRRAPSVNLHVDSPAGIKSAVWDGVGLNPEMLQGLSFFALPPEGAELFLRLNGEDPVEITMFDLSHELPKSITENYQQRPSHYIPAPLYYTDATLIFRIFSF